MNKRKVRRERKRITILVKYQYIDREKGKDNYRVKSEKGIKEIQRMLLRETETKRERKKIMNYVGMKENEGERKRGK